MTTTTLTERPMLTLWTARRHEQDQLAMNKGARQAVCGCSRCGDQDRGQELDYLIRRGLARISEIEDKITDRSGT